MTDTILVATTFSEKEEALDMARYLLQERLIACGQISSPMDSLYQWKGKIEQEKEYRLTMKSSEAHWEALEREISRKHSYDVPEIIAMKALHVSSNYQQWLKEELLS
ncbi:MAG: divalent-cation tolerance protein CutA [Thermodesulfobacteriota bacterium]